MPPLNGGSKSCSLLDASRRRLPEQLRRAVVDHIEIYVSNLDRSTAFWGWLLERLGYSLYQSWPAGRSWRRGSTYLVFVQAPHDTLAAGYDRRRIGLNHLAFQATSTAQVDELTIELRKQRVRVLYEDRHPHAGGPDCYSVFFEDPDGIKVELVLG